MSQAMLKLLLTGLHGVTSHDRDLSVPELTLLQTQALAIQQEIDALLRGTAIKPNSGLFKPKVELDGIDVGALKATGRQYEIMDKQVRGLGIRVSVHGARTFMLKTRYPGSDNPTRRALGRYPEITLEQARTKALEWRALIAKGIDPAQVAA